MPSYQRWLATPISETGLGIGYLRAFWRDNLTTQRDVYVLGKKRLVGMAIISLENLPTIEKALAGAPDNLQLKDRPTVQDIARYCHSLDEVSGLVLGYGPFERMTVGKALESRNDNRAQENVLRYYDSFPAMQCQLIQEDYDKLDYFANCFTEAQRLLTVPVD